jgi:hypothetical protein
VKFDLPTPTLTNAELKEMVFSLNITKYHFGKHKWLFLQQFIIFKIDSHHWLEKDILKTDLELRMIENTTLLI